jgi:signal transduction histidine kinase/CheY-like chemotaxis protein
LSEGDAEVSSPDVEDRSAARHAAADQPLARLAIWEWDLASDRLTWSDEVFELLGLTPGALVPSFEELFTRVHPEDLPELMHVLSRARRDRASLVHAYRVVRPTGEIRAVRARVRATVDARGAVARLIGVEEDATGRSDPGRPTGPSGAVADRRAVIGQLAGGIAHEINNPLATIAATFDLVEQRYPEVVLREARAAIDRVGTVARALAALARGDGGEHRAPQDVELALELAIALASAELRQRANVVRDYGSPLAVLADEAQLTQLFVHLLMMVAAAIPEGFPDRHELRVTTRTDDTGRVLIEVRASGAPAARDRRTRPPPLRAAVDHGAAAPLCRDLVRALGGELHAQSDPGRGSTFTVLLPPTFERPRARRTSAPPPSPDELLQPERRGRVMIVDDEVPFAHSLRRLLAPEHNVAVVTSGREALERLRAGERYDVILCDLMMPELTGADLHVALSQFAPDQAARIIFVTGGAFRPTSQHFLERVPNLYFEKPCDLQELRAAIRRQMGPVRA